MDIKLVMKNNKGFTLIETIISLLLMILLVFCLTLILKVSYSTSKSFLDFSGYEYAMAHKKILQYYNECDKVERTANNITLSKNDEEGIRIKLRGSHIYYEKKLAKNSPYDGCITLFQNVKKHKIEEDIVDNKKYLILTIVDRENKERILRIKVKTKDD